MVIVHVLLVIYDFCCRQWESGGLGVTSFKLNSFVHLEKTNTTFLIQICWFLIGLFFIC